MLTALDPYAATGVETCSVVRRDRSTACEFTDTSISLAALHWREDGRVFAVSALDHGYHCDERGERYCGKPQELLRSEIRVHQWNI
jgi:hypothetical protein